MTGYSSAQSEVPAAPQNADLCRLYGKLVDLSGRPVAYRTLLMWSWPILDQAVISGTAQLLQPPVPCVSKRDGTFTVDIFRGAPISVLLPETRRHYQMVVPDLAVAPLFDFLVPYPIKVSWCLVDPEDNTSHSPILDSEDEPSTLIEALVGDTVYVGLCVEYSDGSVCRKLNIAYEGSLSGDAIFEEESAHVVKITATDAGSVVLTSLELESTVENQSFWERVGFANPLPPQYLPCQAYELQDAEDLIIQFT